MKKKILSHLQLFLIIGIVIISNYSCDTTIEKPKQLAVLTTKTITDISFHNAVCGGIITSDNGLEVSARGVCWSLKPNPTINDSITINAAGTGEFTSNISNLIAETTYYVRAYATNKDGTSYGLQLIFKTLLTVLPTLTTTSVNNITESAASSGGNITSDGGSSITARGVCWSTTANPTISGSKTFDGAGVGTFTSSITALTASTTYYVRAYATNATGTAYGPTYKISTLVATPTVTDVDGNVYRIVTIGTQTWMAENLKTTHYRNGNAIVNVTSNTTWAGLSTGAWCNYDNSVSNGTKYGHLYNWYAVSDTRNIAPVGWHIPTDAEWTTLTNYASTHLGTSPNVAKALADSTTWTVYSTIGTIGCNLTLNNSTGFSALPGGHRDYFLSGSFLSFSSVGNWWSASEDGTNLAWDRELYYTYSTLTKINDYKANGFYVRCVKD